MSAILDELLIAETGTFKQTEFKNSIDETLRTKIPEILKSFSIEGHIVDIEAGPKVTSVYYDLAPGFSIKAIEAKSDDLQVKLGKSSLSISKAPEKNAWAIEVPNSESNSIPFGNVFHSNHIGMSLPAALGVDTKGRPVYLDVAKTPHMLIAGQTGSGKSVCLYSIITSLALNCPPTDLQFLLIDPKRVGFRRYRKLHNLISGNIITGVEEAILALKWLVQEMEARNSIIDECGCEDIKEFKHKLNLGQIDEMPLAKTTDMPYIVAVIDEYADLMMQSSKELEDIICRLAQKARNVGIHLILATQRPSTKIISGDIKGNLPTRIALKTATSTDSQTILGGGGAEKLLGEGDMLLLKDGNLKRIHGCYISKEKIEEIIPQLPTKDLFYFNREDIFTTDFQTYLDNSSKDHPTWGEINAVCKLILDNLDDYLDEKELSIKLGLDNEELATIWQQLNEARNNPETCKLIFEHYIKNSAFAESQFIKFIIFTNFYFEDRKGNYPFLKYILEKAIKEEDGTAFKSAQHFCDPSRYNTKPAIEELDKLGNQETGNSKKYLELKKTATAQASSSKSKQAEQKNKDKKKNSSTSFSHSNATNSYANFEESESLTRIENINIKKGLDAFYEKGETKQAFELLEPIYKRHSSNEYVLGIYLPILVNYNITQAKQTIKSLKISSPAICLAEIEIALLEDDLITVEKKINQGKKLWPSNETLKCYEVLWLIKLAIISGENDFIKEATEIAKTFAETDNKAEKTLQARMCEYLSAITESTDLTNNVVKDELYSNLYSRDLGIKEITVGPTQIVKSVHLAIKMVDAGGTISVDAGLYKGYLEVYKNVHIIGCRDSILNKSSDELPIFVGLCQIHDSVKIEGIVFTTNKNISFGDLDVYIHEDSDFDSNRRKYYGIPLLLFSSCNAILRNVGLLDFKFEGISFVSECKAEISDSIISHCGCGAYFTNCLDKSITNTQISITNTQISYCADGGVIIEGSSPKITNCEIFSNNDAGISICKNAVPFIEICNIHDNEQCGVEIQDSASGTFSSCDIHDNRQYGIWIREKATPVVEKCKIYNNKTEGMFYSGILADDDSTPQINGCEIFGHLSDGIFVKEQAGGTYTNCDIHDNKQDGIWIYENATPTFEKCQIHNNNLRGIRIQDSASGIFSNCNIHDNACQGILARGESKGTFKNCDIHDNKLNGIWIYEKSTPTFEKCKIHDNKTEGMFYSGILVDDDSKPQINGCEISGHLSDGIWERERACGTYTNCSIHDNEQRGICIQDSTSGTFANCDIHDNACQGILACGESKGTFKNCQIHGNKSLGIWICEKAAPVVEKCKIYNNKTEGMFYSGILADDDSKPQINGCEISGHLHDGIWERKQASGTYTNCNIHDNNQRGVEIQDSASGVYSNCEIHNNTRQGILAIGDAKGAFRNCNIHDNKRPGIWIREKAVPTIEKCKIHDNKTEGERYPGVVVANQASPQISSCEISGHLSYGIWIKDNAYGSYTSCKIHDNNKNGVKIEDPWNRGPQISGCPICD